MARFSGMMDFMIRWWRRKQFIKAYRILRNESERHRGAGHDVTFEAINEAYIVLVCARCPESQPMSKGRVF